MTESTDRIEKQALLAAPLARVWEAVSNAGEFGTWFGVTFDGPFVAGRPLFGREARVSASRVIPDIRVPACRRGGCVA